MKSKIGLFLRALALVSLLPISAHAVAYSKPLGVIRVGLSGGGKTNLVSSPFLPQAVFQTDVVSASGNDIVLSATPPSGLEPQIVGGKSFATHYVEIDGGDAAGMVTNIVSVSGDTLTVESDLSSLLLAGDAVVIRSVPTIDSIFGADNRFGFQGPSASFPSPADWDRLYLIDPEIGSDAFLSFVYVDGYGWVDPDYNLAGHFPIYPETGFIFSVVGPDVDVTFVGEVQQLDAQIPVYTGKVNLLTVFNPLSDVAGVDPSRVLTLGTSGLATDDEATGVVPNTGNNDHDIVWLLNDAGSFLPYAYISGYGWVDSSYGLANDVKLDSGESILLQRRKTGASDFNWIQPNLHMP